MSDEEAAPDFDWVLQTLVHKHAIFEPDHEGPAEIMLLVKGSIVVGNLISPVRWYTLLDKDAATDPDIDLSYKEDGPKPFYIHLKNATIYVGQPVTLSRGLWRVRLSEVSGWAFSLDQVGR